MPFGMVETAVGGAHAGQLVQLLAPYQAPDANIYAVYPAQHRATARVQAFVDFMAEAILPDAQPAVQAIR